MSRVLLVAAREFRATAMTKGFVIFTFIVPALVMGLMLVSLPFLMVPPRPVHGVVGVIDPTHRVGPAITAQLLAEPDPIDMEDVEAAAGELGMPTESLTNTGPLPAFARQPASNFDVEIIKPEADLESAKARLLTDPPELLALLSISPDAVGSTDPDTKLGSYELYIRPGLDQRHAGRIREATTQAIQSERIRALGLGLDAQDVRRLMRVAGARTIEVTPDKEQQSLGSLRIVIAFGFMFLIFLPVLTSGHFLLTAVIEEKSSRVVEVLLSALSPMQLMAGKILGQLAVGLTIMTVYGFLGGGALVMMSFSSELGLWNIACLIIFFLIAYGLIATMLAAIGSAVNDLREAQALQTPVMMMVMLAYLLSLPIAFNPSSPFAIGASFVPVMSPFAMILRIASPQPPPVWQVGLAVLIGVVSVAVAVWAAAKIFRVGLLMFGKPPSLLTLLRWIRMS